MPRNHYAKIVHKGQRAQIARREKELAALAKELHNNDVELDSGLNETPFTDMDKQRRRERLEQKRLHKARRSDATGTGQA